MEIEEKVLCKCKFGIDGWDERVRVVGGTFPRHASPSRWGQKEKSKETGNLCMHDLM